MFSWGVKSQYCVILYWTCCLRVAMILLFGLVLSRVLPSCSMNRYGTCAILRFKQDTFRPSLPAPWLFKVQKSTALQLFLLNGLLVSWVSCCSRMLVQALFTMVSACCCASMCRGWRATWRENCAAGVLCPSIPILEGDLKEHRSARALIEGRVNKRHRLSHLVQAIQSIHN